MITLMVFAVLGLQEPTPAEDVEKQEVQELKDLWMKVIESCREEKRDELQAMIGAMEMTRDEMVKLFGEEKTAKVYPAYQETWKKQVKTEAVPDLMARRVRGGWNDVDVWCVNEAPEPPEEDRVVLNALADGAVRVYNVRLRRADKKEGLVLRGLIKTESGWKMSLKIGRVLAEQ
ncbi:MAG: hypothetical protein HYY16_12120 [Planctomycetes bacterium]|nr:hypothetical protein [Planctomycetota bacterium]